MINVRSRMILKSLLFVQATVFMSCISCGDSNTPDIPDPGPQNDLVIKSEIIHPSFMGNGVQWGGYDILKTWTGSPTLSGSDWDKLFLRVRFLRPSIVRIMGAPGWNYLVNGQYDPSKSEAVLVRILDFCQQEGIDVMFGEWGHTGGEGIDQEWLENSAKFLEWLINTKGYSCIRYFNMVNEPNGDWSTINGNYPLWRDLIGQFHARLVAKGIDSKVKIIGPDIAVWGTNLISWVLNTTSDLSDQVGACDIHTYPKETEVRDGSYFQMIRAYRNAVPEGKEMLMGELGFKYAASSVLDLQNDQRIAADKYASEDSNMMVYDAFYGIDMADAVIQNMRAGYSGVIVWDLDDAMYNKGESGSTKLKRWGFWNILGEEKFEDPDDENIRPWFYTMSLLCRYFPQGTTICQVSLPDKAGLRAVAGEKDGKQTIAIVNSHTVDYTVNLRAENGTVISNARIYRFTAGKNGVFTGAVDANGFAKPETTGETISLQGESYKQLDIPAQSFLLITNRE